MTRKKTLYSSRSLMIATAAIALTAVGVPSFDRGFSGSPAAAQSANFPKPHVSRAIDATLLDITPDVRREFGIDAGISGVLVLAVDPDGVAAGNNILAGDIITDVRGKRVDKAIDVDTYVLYFLKKGDDAFQFAGNRDGQSYDVAAEITLALFEAAIDFSDMASWNAVSTESFSYTEYYEEYSEVIVEEYTYSETIIEETVTSESFEEEITDEDSDDAADDEDDADMEDGDDDGEDDGEDDGDDDGDDTEDGDEDGDDTDDGDDGGDDDMDGDDGDDEEGDGEDEADDGGEEEDGDDGDN